jgi:hypothetical protein
MAAGTWWLMPIRQPMAPMRPPAWLFDGRAVADAAAGARRKSVKTRKPCEAVQVYYAAIGAFAGSLR